MSSTNRGKSTGHVRSDNDYYVTPVPAVVKFIESFGPDRLRGKRILDPCAGGDERHEMSYPAALAQFGIFNVMTSDIREDSRAVFKRNFLDIESLETTPQIIITNPPFDLAAPIIEKSLELVERGGYVIMLLRLNFFGSKGREDFWKRNMPSEIYVHTRRMSFQDNSKTDSIEYAHIVWQKGCAHNPILSLVFG